MSRIIFASLWHELISDVRTPLCGVLGCRCLTGSALLGCHVLKGFGVYRTGMLGSLSDVVGGSSCTFVHSPCILLVNIYQVRVLSHPFFLFLPLTKLPHPNTIYRAWCWQWVLASELCKSRAKGTTYTLLGVGRDVQTFPVGVRGPNNEVEYS